MAHQIGNGLELLSYVLYFTGKETPGKFKTPLADPAGLQEFA